MLPLPHPLDKRLDIDDPDAVEVLEVSEVRVEKLKGSKEAKGVNKRS